MTNLNLENYILHVVSVFIDAFLKVFLEVGVQSLQHCSVDLGNFLANRFFQILQCTRLMLIHTCLEVPLQEIITNRQIRGSSEPRSISKSGNEAVTEERLKYVHWCSDCVGHCSILLKPHTSHRHTFSS